MEIHTLHTAVEGLEFKTMLNEADDQRAALLTINAGAGGTESQDWAQMLHRMYTRYCEQAGFSYDTVELQYGEVAGIKSASIEISGDFAYGYLKAENGYIASCGYRHLTAMPGGTPRSAPYLLFPLLMMKLKWI